MGFAQRLFGLGQPVEVAREMAANNEVVLNVDVQLGSSGQSYVVSPIDGTVIDVYSVINSSLSTSDEKLTVKDADGNSMGDITLTQSGSAAGDVDSLTPSSNAGVSAGDAIEVETDGSNGTSTQAFMSIRVRRA